MRKIGKPKIKNTVVSLIIGLSYPSVKYFASETNKLLNFLDALTIMGLVYICGGIFTTIYLHGDIDSIVFRMKHPKISENISYEDYIKELQKKREESFNYPLFIGLLFLVLSYVIAGLFY